MSSEITVTAGLSLLNGNVSASQPIVSGAKYDQAGADASNLTQDIPTTSAGTAVTVASSVSTLGWSFWRNCDSTNYVEIGVQVSGTFYPLVRMKAGEPALFRLSPGATPYARADTASVKIQVLIIEA